MSFLNNTDSRISFQSSGFPVAIRRSEYDDVWNSIRAEQQQEQEQEQNEEFDMGDREYKILQAPSSTIELGGLVSKICSLPTMEVWHVIVTFSVIVMYMLGIYCIFFVPHRLIAYIPLYLICDFVYLIDLVLNLLHRYWKKLYQKFQLKHKRKYLLFFDGLSLLPQEIILGSILGYQHWSTVYCRLISFVRLYRVMQLFDDILGSVRSCRWSWFLAQYVLLFSMALHTAVCIWFYMGSTPGDEADEQDAYWATMLLTSQIRLDSIYDWYLCCLYIAVTFMSNTGFGDFYATRLNEGLYCIAVMLTGFILVTVLIAVLTVQLVNVGYRRAKFAYEIKNVKDVLQQINASPELSKQVLGYYQVLWTNKNGVNEAPELYTLPTPLRMELMYDINIAHLQNSLLLRNQPEALLRKISLLIKHVFLLPGDVFFHQGVVKGKMVFVASGILEILSDEDDQSPIISFRAGTVLGEVSLVMTVPAKATVRAATYVELQVIERQDFMRMMLDHPDANTQFRKNIAARLEKADSEQGIYDKDHVIMNLLVSNAREFRPIKLLKDHLSNFKEQDAERVFMKSVPGFDDEPVPSSSNQRATFSEDCLSLYKLSSNYTMIERSKVCTSSNFPWIFRPRSSLVYYWNNIVNISQVLLCLILPYHIVYVRELPHFIQLYCYLADSIYLLDIYVRCSTAVELRNRTIKKFKEIVNYRMRFLSFYVDVFSLFPIEVMAFSTHLPSAQQNRLFYLLKLNRLFRIWRLNKIFKNLEQDMSRNMLVLYIIKYTIYLMLSAFWAGAVLYLESCTYPICTNGNWFNIKMIDAIKLGHVIPCHEHPVALSTYFGTMSLFLVGYGDVLPNSKVDFVFVCGLILLGIFLVCYCTAQLCATFSLSDRFRRDFQENVVAFGRFLEQNYLMHSLYKRVITFFCLQWYYDKGTGRDFLLNSAPPHLRSSLQTTELKQALSKTPLFEMVDVDFLLMIAEGARVQVLPSDEVIAYTGDMSREMYIVLSGHCEVLSDAGIVLDCYGPGSQFGVLEMIYGIPKRYTTRTVTNCKVISVDYRTYVQAMSMFPMILLETKRVMEETDLLEWIRLVDAERLHAKAIKKIETKRNITERLFKYCNNILLFFKKSFVFTKHQCKNSRGKEDYWAPFKTMQKFRFVGYLLLPLAIHPQGPFIRIWCVIRVITIMIVCLVGPFYIAVTPFAAYLYWIMLAANVCAYLDIYLLFHMGYYNEKGLLITHPKYTASNYVTRSFVVDILAVFPFHLLVLWENPEHSEGHDYITHLITPHIRHCSWHLNGLLQFHRVHELFHYMEGNILKNMDLIRFFKFFPLSMVLINLISSLIFALNCTYKFYDIPQNDTTSELVVLDTDTDRRYYGYLKCKNGSWLEKSQFGSVTTNPLEVYLIAIYWVTSTILGVGMGDVSAYSKESMYIVVFTILLGRLLFAYVFASLATGRAQFSIVMSKYQENLKDLMKFLKHEEVDPHWQKKLFLYFEYVWKRTSGVESQELCQKLNTALMEDTVVFLYEKTLREVPLFENVEKSFIRVIAKHLTQEYFLRGDTVIRSYDIQSNIYIIYRGKVEVLSSYNEMIACMGPGGLFGNIRQVNAGCSSVSIIASRNLDVLVITSETFYGVIKDYPRIKRNMDNLLETVTDYIMPTTIIDEENDSNVYSETMSGDTSDRTMPSQESGSVGESGSQMTPRRSFGSFSTTSHLQLEAPKRRAIELKQMLSFCLPHRWFRFALYPDHLIAKITTGAVLLVAYFNVLEILYCFVTQSNNLSLLYCSLLLETVFYFKIFLQFHMAYMDRYGNYITRFKKIARHYFSNHSRVFWDVVPNLPLEPLCFLFRPEKRTLALSVLRLIHILRIKYMLDYFRDVNQRLMANLAINQILKIALFLSITVHVFACTWLMTACPFDYCLPNSWVDNFNFTSHEPFHRYAVSTYYVVSLATTTGVGDIFPNTMSEVLFSIAVMLISRFLTALIIGDMVTIINLSSRSLVQYEYRIYCLQDFLQNQYLSGHQMEKLWGYVKNLWAQEKGQHIPLILKDCPYVLRCDIMNVMFGHHLRNSFLFKGINEALLRQLAVRLNRVVFFQGNYIVQDGDIDQNMYFIHSGEVSVLTVHSNLTETQHELLKTHDMFGLAQGLYHGLPHRFSFRAYTKVSILVLNLDCWNHMLKYFPKDKEIIYNRAQTVYVTV